MCLQVANVRQNLVDYFQTKLDDSEATMACTVIGYNRDKFLKRYCVTDNYLCGLLNARH